MHELRAYLSYLGVGGELSYFRTAAGLEIDFIWSRGKRHVGIEVKASERWRSEDKKALASALADGIIDKAFAVYLGDAPLRDGDIQVFPVQQFVDALYAGKIIAGV